MRDARIMDRPANDLLALGTKAIAGEDDTDKRSKPSRERNGEIESRKVESTMFSRFSCTSHRISAQQQAVIVICKKLANCLALFFEKLQPRHPKMYITFYQHHFYLEKLIRPRSLVRGDEYLYRDFFKIYCGYRAI